MGADPLSSAPSGPIDVLLLPGGAGVKSACRDQRLVGFVVDAAPRARRLVTVCSGTFLAAAAGLLDGRRVTTHWARAKELQAKHSAIDVDPDPIYVRDGDVWTSAGVTAGIDLALALVEDDHGAEVAQLVARWLVMFLRRPGGQTQFATPVWNERPPTGPIRAAQEAIDADPGGDHRVVVLAERVGMSERHFIRCFSSSVGSTPAQYVAAVRTEAARRALESTPDTVETIARRCGFGSGETMRRTFARRLGVSPDSYRQRFST
jgi:transcriptional regulator GlxA family with amidase domain